MNDSVKPTRAVGPKAGRVYDSAVRAERAAATRRAILRAARESFVERGYVASTVADISRRADVAIDTIYASVGKKPALLRELVETSISGMDQTVPAAERMYVIEVRAAGSAPAKLSRYAAAVVAIHTRLAPIFSALREAAATDKACAGLWTEISERRATNMMEFAADLRMTGELRADLNDREVADIIWSMNAVEYWLLLVQQRGWSPERFQRWLVDAWSRLLLSDSPTLGDS